MASADSLSPIARKLEKAPLAEQHWRAPAVTDLLTRIETALRDRRAA